MRRTRHSAPATRAGLRRARARRSMLHRLVATAGCAGAVGLMLAGVDGTYALWSDSAPSDAGTIDSGTAELTTAWAGSPSDIEWQNMLPGERGRTGVILVNTGEAPLTLTATMQDDAGGFEVRMIAGACATTPLTSPPLDATGMPLGAADAPELAVTLDPATSMDACVEVTATSALLPGEDVAFAIRLDGVQHAIDAGA